jgi:hypothetical protein
LPCAGPRCTAKRLYAVCLFLALGKQDKKIITNPSNFLYSTCATYGTPC